MYISLGKNTFLTEEEIIGVFDLDITSQSYLTREFLSAAEKRGTVRNVAEDLPNAFVLCGEKEKQTVFLIQNTSGTLKKKLDQLQEERRTAWQKTSN